MKNISIKEFAIDERPMEKMLKYGPESLSNVELLAILIGSGDSKRNALNLASEILTYHIIGKELLGSSLDELMGIKGIGLSKASRIVAGLNLGKRLSANKNFKDIVFDRPKSIADFYYEYYLFDDREKFCVLLLDTKNQPISNILVSMGTLNSSLVHPREVFKPAIKKSANSIVLVHNHPSGNPTPSAEDIQVTKRLKESGDILGIKVLDHIIIGDRKYISLAEKGIF